LPIIALSHFRDPLYSSAGGAVARSPRAGPYRPRLYAGIPIRGAAL